MSDTHETAGAVKATGDDEATIFPSVDPADVAGAVPLDDDPPAAPRRGRGRPRKDGKPAGSVPPTPKGAKPVGRPTSQAQRAKRVADLYSQLGGILQFAGVASVKAAQVGTAMSASANDLGAAWATWAETNPRVAKLIDGMSFGGGAVAVLLAHLPIVLALAADDSGSSPLDLLAGFAGLAGAGVFGAPAAAPAA